MEKYAVCEALKRYKERKKAQEYKDVMTLAQHDKEFESMVQAMTVDRIMGKSSLKKNKYNF